MTSHAHDCPKCHFVYRCAGSVVGRVCVVARACPECEVRTLAELQELADLFEDLG